MGGHHVCPASHAGLLDHPLRRLLHPPERILGPYIRPGDTVIDIGCGSGFFTRPMARMVGDEGCVIAADLQQGMLERLRVRAGGEGVLGRIRLHRTSSDSLDLAALPPVDFALAFYVVHEVPDVRRFFREVAAALRPGGMMLVVEPVFHVGEGEFAETVRTAQGAGFLLEGAPRILFGRTALLRLPHAEG
ncbi:class I SAM-dependent methyltransferase [Methanofollis fontis]|nr:methyltransferase domain-containing protein [Methanofollis fontis]